MNHGNGNGLRIIKNGRIVKPGIYGEIVDGYAVVYSDRILGVMPESRA